MSEAPDSVLVVEDDKDIQGLLRTAFEAKGYQVRLADHGLAGVDALRAARPDLVILDLMMPSLDGWAALAEIRKCPDPPPVVVVSGVPEVNITPRIFREGVAAFVSKPFRLDVLLNTCGELIARAKGRRLVYGEKRSGARRTVPLEVAVLSLDGRLLHRARVVNLSVQGAQVEMPSAVPPGERLRLGYTPADGGMTSFQCRVQWWRRAESPSDFTVHGLAFTGLSAEDQHRIKEIAGLD